MVEFLAERGIEGAMVLEVGGGLGEVQIELLKRGAARSVNLELSPAYPGYKRLLGAAAAHARRALVFSYPRRNALSRAVVAAQNIGFRLRRREFRTFAHPPAAMLVVLQERGLEPTFAHKGAAWQLTGLVR
ncbi:MAG: hypothetical protein ABI611_11480 [Solirubrobacteraceae bacterium]